MRHTRIGRPGENRLFVMSGSTNGLGLHLLVQRIGSTLSINRPIEIGVSGLQIKAAGNGISRVVQRQGVVLPVVVPHHALERGQISNRGLVTSEDLGTSTHLEIRGNGVDLGTLLVSTHLIDKGIEGDIVAGPVSKLEDSSLVSTLAILGHLLNNPESIVHQWLPRGKFVVVDNHPLVVVGTRVVLNEDFGPGFSVLGHTVGSDHTNPVQQALRDHVLVQGHVHHNQGSLDGHQSTVHLVVVITRGESTRSRGERDSGGLGGGVVQVEGVGFEDPKHGRVIIPGNMPSKELGEVRGHLNQSGAVGGFVETVAELRLGEGKPVRSLLRGHERFINVIEIAVSLEAKELGEAQFLSGFGVSVWWREENI